MIFNKLPQQLQKFAHYSVLAAAISLVAITANAGNYKAKKDIDVVMVDSATVAAVDVMVSNDVIHVIDEVILPN